MESLVPSLGCHCQMVKALSGGTSTLLHSSHPLRDSLWYPVPSFVSAPTLPGLKVQLGASVKRFAGRAALAYLPYILCPQMSRQNHGLSDGAIASQ